MRAWMSDGGFKEARIISDWDSIWGIGLGREILIVTQLQSLK